MKKLIITTIALLLLSVQSIAQEPVTYAWTPPTTGSNAESYNMYISINDSEYNFYVAVVDTVSTVTLVYDFTYIFKVSGVDILGREGPMSLPSDPYTPTLGPPGIPGRPVIHIGN